jgi:hypothetical protein
MLLKGCEAKVRERYDAKNFSAAEARGRVRLRQALPGLTDE